MNLAPPSEILSALQISLDQLGVLWPAAGEALSAQRRMARIDPSLQCAALLLTFCVQSVLSGHSSIVGSSWTTLIFHFCEATCVRPRYKSTLRIKKQLSLRLVMTLYRGHIHSILLDLLRPGIVVLPKWSIEFFCHSDVCSFKQVIKLAEHVRGVSKLRLRDSLGSFSFGLHRQYPFPCPGTQAKPIVVNIPVLQAGH